MQVGCHHTKRVILMMINKQFINENELLTALLSTSAEHELIIIVEPEGGSPRV